MPNPNAVKVVLHDGREFETVREAMITLGVGRDSLRKMVVEMRPNKPSVIDHRLMMALDIEARAARVKGNRVRHLALLRRVYRFRQMFGIGVTDVLKGQANADRALSNAAD